jgi:hypothetical protein
MVQPVNQINHQSKLNRGKQREVHNLANASQVAASRSNQREVHSLPNAVIPKKNPAPKGYVLKPDTKGMIERQNHVIRGGKSAKQHGDRSADQYGPFLLPDPKKGKQK